MYRSRCILPATFFAVTFVSTVLANDWPQWMGPGRTGLSAETGLLKAWPKAGPKVKWKAKDLGEGYSAPAVVGNRIYLLGMFDKAENVIALDEKDGSPIWSVKIGTVGANPTSKGNFWPGPRGTPTVVGKQLFALGSDGDLVCLDLTKGDLVWKKNLRSDFGGKPGAWAYSESPLIDGDALIVSPGGDKATVVALSKTDGKVLWKSPLGDKAAYGSPIAIEAGGAKQYVVFLSKGLAGLAASDGKLLWRFDKPGNKGGINIPTPVFHDGQIFGVSAYGSGGGVAKLAGDKDKQTATESWYEKKIASRIGGFLCLGDYLYGAGGGRNTLMCVEFSSGKIVWEKECVGAASLCAADGMLYVRGHDDGFVALVEASPTAYKEHGRFKQPERSEKPAWPYPVIANGCLYLRDQAALLCFDVRAAK